MNFRPHDDQNAGDIQNTPPINSPNFPNQKIIWVLITALSLGNRRLRRRNAKSLQKLCSSICRFGIVRPILIDCHNNIIDGHAIVDAARELGIDEVPAIVIDHLTKAEIRALGIALNRLQELGEWNEDVLKSELETILELDEDFELEVTGFEIGKIDYILDGPHDDNADTTDPADTLPELSSEPTVTRTGDIWTFGDRHRVLCGDAKDAQSYVRLLQGMMVRMVFIDPPYNVKIQGHVSGLGRTRHREFHEASGEMSREQFLEFLKVILGQHMATCVDGALLYCCMDWRSIDILLAAAQELGLQLINICVWNKKNGSMGSFYRSKFELVAVFKYGNGPHINNIELGRHGRYRTNVWDYQGVNSFGGDRMAQLASHPTPKPVALVSDAIKDCTKPGDLVLDGCAGSGTTLVSAHKARRRAALIEIDPGYVDVIVRRFQETFGIEAIHEATDLTFTQLAERRRIEAENPDLKPLVRRRVRTRLRPVTSQASEVTS